MTYDLKISPAVSSCEEFYNFAQLHIIHLGHRMSVVQQNILRATVTKPESCIPSKLRHEPESAVVTEDFEEVTTAAKVETVLVRTACEYRSLKCFCAQRQTTSGAEI